MSCPVLRFSTTAAVDRVAPGEKARVHVVAEIVGLAQGEDAVRPPLCLVFAVDVSGSMAGPPLEHVVRSIDRLVSLLAPDDRVGLVAFSNDAAEVMAVRVVDADTKRLVRTRASRLQADGRTNVEAGLRHAAAMMPPRGAHQRQIVLLLSDGAPNVGVCTKEGLGSMAASLRPDITVSTLGYGPAHHEDVLSAVAVGGAGRYHFIADPTICEVELAQAIGAQGDVIAEALELAVTPSRYATVTRVMGGLPVRFGGGALGLALPDLLEEARLVVALEVEVAAPRDAIAIEIVRAELAYRNAGRKEPVSIVQSASVRVKAGAPEPTAAAAAAVLLVRGEEVRAEARGLGDRGQFDGAAAALRGFLAEVARAPFFKAGDGSPLAEAYELVLDEAMALERKPSAADYGSFRKASVSSSVFDARSSMPPCSERSRSVVSMVAGAFPMAHVEVTTGEQAGRRHRLGPRQAIGRTPGAEIQLIDPGVSRLHAEIVAQRGVFLLVTTSSTNATRVNGARIDAPHALQSGDVIHVGASKLVYTEDN